MNSTSVFGNATPTSVERSGGADGSEMLRSQRAQDSDIWARTEGISSIVTLIPLANYTVDWSA